MGKIKNMISGLSNESKELFKKFPVTMVLIAICTFLYAIMAGDYDFIRDTEIFEKCTTFCVIWGIGTFFTETFFSNKVKKIISYGVTGGISLIFTIIGFSSCSYIDKVVELLITYILVMFFITIFKTIKNENLSFNEYIVKLFKNLLNCTIVYSILAIGITILSVIFVELLLDGDFGSGLAQIHILLLGLYYISSILYSISATNKKEPNAFSRGLILYVFFPLVVIAMIIIYMYIAKILIIREVPKNIIFRILAGIFIVAFPIWNMVDYYADEKKIFKTISKYLPILYIPFIFLEMYSIGKRIGEFGITPLRYAGVVFIIIQIISFILTFYKKKEKLSYLYIVMAIMSIICILTPLNYEKISIISQRNIIEKTFEKSQDFDDLSIDQKRKVRGAYNYLKMNDDNEYSDYLASKLSNENINKIEDYDKSNTESYIRSKYFYNNIELNLQIEKYIKIVEVSGDENDSTKIEFLEINKELDLSEFIKNIINENDIDNIRAKDYFKENNLVKFNDGDLFIKHINLRYINDREIEYVSVDGYWLEK